MPSWTKKQRAYVVEYFLKNGESVIAVQRAFKREFKLKRHDKPPDRKIILKWVENFRETGSVVVHNHPGRRRSSGTPQNIEKVRAAMTRSPRRSVRRQAMALKIPRTSLRRIIRGFKHASIQITTDPGIAAS